MARITPQRSPLDAVPPASVEAVKASLSIT
jgi:hypothetical protein